MLRYTYAQGILTYTSIDKRQYRYTALKTHVVCPGLAKVILWYVIRACQEMLVPKRCVCTPYQTALSVNTVPPLCTSFHRLQVVNACIYNASAHRHAHTYKHTLRSSYCFALLGISFRPCTHAHTAHTHAHTHIQFKQHTSKVLSSFSYSSGPASRRSTFPVIAHTLALAHTQIHPHVTNTLTHVPSLSHSYTKKGGKTRRCLSLLADTRAFQHSSCISLEDVISNLNLN